MAARNMSFSNALIQDGHTQINRCGENDNDRTGLAQAADVIEIVVDQILRCRDRRRRRCGAHVGALIAGRRSPPA